ncbi:hypothetical protein D917_04014 [Trichinella nativa]|uniref:Uncharacterized protein n=1 Tax=Trichinella nativa TaxID=6335 RepID=A0A1Y3E752_9BILA|nr:hypothetical protein D917_04014 [Trichinella nativa]
MRKSRGCIVTGFVVSWSRFEGVLFGVVHFPNCAETVREAKHPCAPNAWTSAGFRQICKQI